MKAYIFSNRTAYNVPHCGEPDSALHIVFRVSTFHHVKYGNYGQRHKLPTETFFNRCEQNPSLRKTCLRMDAGSERSLASQNLQVLGTLDK
eukprot:1159892-Pelagomonas_calceolata.AAC.29